MFETRINKTQFTGALADSMFRRINGCDYEGDYSFLSTLRALLMHRLSGDQKVTFHAYNMQLQDNPREMHDLFSSFVTPNSISYVSVSKSSLNQTNDQEMFLSFHAPDFLHEFADVQTFFAEKMVCRAWIHEESRCAIVAVLDSTVRKHHLVQCIIPKLLPWFFAGGRLSVMERNLLYALRENTNTSYLSTLERFSDTDEFRQKKATMSLVTIKHKELEKQKLNTKQTIQSSNERISALLEEISKQQKFINEQNFKLNGILLALESEETDTQDLAQFITSNPYVTLVDMDDDTVSFLVTGYLDVFDPESYRTLSANPRSWYWTESSALTGPFVSRENRKLVLDAIFGDTPVFKIKTYGVYAFDIDSNRAGVGRTSRLPDPPQDRYANPHLYYASCLGTYRSYINTALGRGNLAEAISYCISSVHSVNVTESATFRYLCRDIFVNEQPILEGPGGKSYTTLQAYEYLTAQQNQSEGES